MPSSSLDFLYPYPSIEEPELQVKYEDDQKIIDDILTISKPKALVPTPPKFNLSLEEMLKNPDVFVDKRLTVSDLQNVRNFYYGKAEKIRLGILIKYLWKNKPPSYFTVKNNCFYGIRTVNQKLYISDKKSEIIAGITDRNLLSNGNMKNSPDFAEVLFKVKTKSDLYTNQYLYSKTPPSYDSTLTASKQTTQDSNLNPIKKNIKLSPSMTQDVLPLCLMYVEVFCKTRNDLLPDPEFDSIFFVAVKVRDDLSSSVENIFHIGTGQNVHLGKHNLNITYLISEKELLRAISDEITFYDPDVIISYEAEKAGIGYLIKRAKCIGFDFIARSSRQNSFIVQQTYRYKKLSSLLPGRIILSVWRLIKMQTNFYSYSLQNLLYSCLEIRFAYISDQNLTKLCDESVNEVYDYIWDVLYYSKKLIEHYGFLERNAALAQIYGIDYESVFTRGSQFRVEAMLKKQLEGTEYLLLSAMKDQVNKQTKLECVPLVLEPPKEFWSDPVIVLDFQSLYPSIMIAYNLCYSTCLGKIKSQTYKKFGVTYMKRDVFNDVDLIITPNNVGFVKQTIRQGFIPLMMHELLQTRVMIKNTMKTLDKNSSRYQKLFTEQFGIKMLCNTTYGYAGAGDTGRMPCNDLADSIVAIARKTLEDAIDVVNSNNVWNAKVIYGDTDSIMVLLKGRTLEQAFVIGREIAQTITSMNPKPIELLLENVYFPMITLAKKHYAGMKYEKPDSTPYYNAKGIETVRTDFCALSSNILEEVLISLFNDRDITNIHSLLVRKWKKILSNKFPLKDFILYEKVILGEYKNPPAGIKVSHQNMEIDKMRKPLFGEKVGYVIVSGEPGDHVTDLAVDPRDFMSSNQFSLNLEYYIEKQINAVLDRTLSPLGIDPKIWFKLIPKRKGLISIQNLQPSKNVIRKSNSRIEKYFNSAHCLVCRQIVLAGAVCETCMANTQMMTLALMANFNSHESKLLKLNSVCRACSGSRSEILCTSLDCPVYYSRIKGNHEKQMFFSKLNDLSW